MCYLLNTFNDTLMPLYVNSPYAITKSPPEGEDSVRLASNLILNAAPQECNNTDYGKDHEDDVPEHSESPLCPLGYAISLLADSSARTFVMRRSWDNGQRSRNH